jgi:putative sterol carrier protein
MPSQWAGSSADMTKQELAAKMQAHQAWVTGKRIKLDFRDQGVVLLDGQSGQVSEQDAPADTTISTTWADFERLEAGQMDPMSAFMTGKLRIEGDMANAMQLATLLSKLRS